MQSHDDVDLGVALRRWPARTGLFAIGPVVLAVLQLVNSALNGLAVWAALPFAAVMVGYAAVSARLLLASLRRATLDAHVAH